MNDRILEPEIEVPAPDDWAGEDAIRSCTGASLQSQIEAFLASGGRVQVVPEGVGIIEQSYANSREGQSMAKSRKRGATISGRVNKGVNRRAKP